VSFFDDNDLREISEENLRYFYEEFSNNVRRILLSKNLIAPNSVYDILYPQTRDALVSRNIPRIEDLERNSAFIRDALLAKNISENVSLEKLAEDTRKALLARTKITTETEDLLKKALVVRDDLLSKNIENKSDIEKDSESFRQNNIIKNKPNENAQFESEYNNSIFREKNIAANVPSESDIENDSEGFRNKNISLNDSKQTDIEKDSSQFRDKNISANIPNTSDLESDSFAFRNKNISANVANGSDLENDSEEFLKKNTSANVSSESSLETDSDSFRNKNISANAPSVSDIEKDSESFRNKNISANAPKASDIESDSAPYRNKNVVANVPKESDIERDSEEIRAKNTSANVAKESDIESESRDIRINNTSLNVPKLSDLEKDSQAALKNNLSLNAPNESDLIADSETFLKNNVSLNAPKESDLVSDSEQFYKDNTAANIPSTSDIATDSVPFYNSNVAANVPNPSDIATDSVPFYNSNVAANVPNPSDLATDSVPFYNSNVAANVPNPSDLATDSVPFYNSNIAPNVPNNSDLATDSVPFYNSNVAANVPNDSDLETDSIPYYTNNTAANVPSESDLLSDSEEFLNNNISGNVPSVSDIEKDSVSFRDINISANVPGTQTIDQMSEKFRKNNLVRNPPSKQLGVVVEGLGTSAFLGVSNVLLQGVLLRQILLSKNRSSRLSIETYSKGMQNNAVFENTNETINIHGSLQAIYGTSEIPTFGRSLLENTRNGYITDAIRDYNISRNSYNIGAIQPFNADYYNVLKSNTNEGFQELLASTPNSFVIRTLNFSQLAPSGNYTYKNPEEVFRATELMAKTTPGNPLMDQEFQAGTKGVLGIIRKIRDSKESVFSRNYDVQNQNSFVVGRDGSVNKISRQRYTIANPYSAGNAKRVLFYLQNYASGDGFYFPPYIQDYSESFAANWNTLNYLGRPESIYTYNNSSREGTITFIVLTDYSNDVLLGTNFADENMQPIKLTKTDLNGKRFTTKDVQQNENKKVGQRSVDQATAKKQQIDDEIKIATEFGKTTNDPGTQDINNRDIANLKKQADSLTKSINNAFVGENRDTNYSESNKNMVNVYNNISTNATENSESKLLDTKERLRAMIANLAFQPAFFSGDKVDFVTKMDFLGKMTRPSSAQGNSGFSFTRPPVCRIKLGDWWDSDIIVDSVSYTMTDAPWTLDGGRVQPMWATVSINFKFVGAYGSTNGSPVLSDDVNGFYAPRGTRSSTLK